MKKSLLICLMGLLCLPISTVKAKSKVASPPEQEGAIPSVPLGALIYGEIINPDSLGPFQIQVQPYKLLADNPLYQTVLDIQTTHGRFFDGVLDPRVRKFEVSLPFSSEYAYLSFGVQGRPPILDNFLIKATDSVKIGLDLQQISLVFAGPQATWFEAQYAVARARQQVRFDAPRILIQSNPAAYLNQKDYRAQWEAANARFGARLQIVGFGKDGLDHILPKLTLADHSEVPGYSALLEFEDILSPERYHLLEAELLGQYFASKIKSFRQNQYSMSLALGDSASVEKVMDLLPSLNDKLQGDLHRLHSNQVSVGYNQFLYEWLKLKAIETGLPLEQLVVQEFDGPIKDRLLATFVEEELAKGYFNTEYLESVMPQLTSEPWKSHLDSMQRRLQLGIALQPVTFSGLNGEDFSLAELKGIPTLFYFYFSTCAHSANYFHRYLWPIYQQTAAQAGYRLVAVSVDDDPSLWKSSLAEYSDPSLLNLNLPQTVHKNWLEYYLVDAFPRTMLLDADGKLLSLNVTGEDFDSYKENLLDLLSAKPTYSTSN